MRSYVQCIRVFATVFILCFTAVSGSAQTLNEKLATEDPSKLAEQARVDGDIVRGAILFHQGNINCAKCHRPTSEKDRLGPDLSRLGPEATDLHIIESILNPSKKIKEGFESYKVLTEDGRTFTGVKVSEDGNQIVIRDSTDVDKLITIKRADLEEIQPAAKSSMPDGLANELKNRQQFLDLLRYVIDIKERGPEATQTEQELQANQTTRELSSELGGLVLMQKLNCVACHQSESLQSPIAAKQAPRLKWSAANLNPGFVAAFIANPHAVKPDSTMPRLLGAMNDEARTKAATAITHFLISEVQNDFELQPIDGEAMHRGYELFNSVGCVACHSPRDEAAKELPIEDSISLGDLSGKYNSRGLSEFLEDPLAVRSSGHMPNMQLTHREAVDVSNFLLQSQAELEGVASLVPNLELAKQGKSLFSQHKCASCHSSFVDDASDLGQQEIAATAPSLENLDSGKGCLSGQAGNWPDFHLDEGERKSIQAALQSHPIQLDDRQQIEVTLTAYNCVACHRRGDFGGISPDRNPHFKTTNLNLGDQGRVPPALTGVGAKLNPKWMRDVLVNHRSIRPYMKTRMPQYGEENIGHLPKLFADNDRLSDTKFAEFEDQKTTREKGHQLAGHKGLNCVACHTYQFKISDTMPAVDLTEMSERLKKDWFYQYMLDPQRFSPNTVMPSFWPAGKAIRADIEGSPEDQVEALWQYLIDGRQARAPSGVVREPLEILVTDEAKMLRRSYPGIGKRGIGVGYPGGVNIAFDAEQLRLAAIWRGGFAEAGGVWRGQGSGTVRPMSRPVEFAKGPDLDDANKPWVVDDGRPPNHQFKGYSLDEARRPTFLYSFGATQVEDFFTEVRGQAGGKTRLTRTVTFRFGDQREELVFRIATGAEISEEDGVFSIGKRLKIRVSSEHQPRIVDTANGKRLELVIEKGPLEIDDVTIGYLLD